VEDTTRFNPCMTFFNLIDGSNRGREKLNSQHAVATGAVVAVVGEAATAYEIWWALYPFVEDDDDKVEDDDDRVGVCEVCMETLCFREDDKEDDLTKREERSEFIFSCPFCSSSSPVKSSRLFFSSSDVGDKLYRGSSLLSKGDVVSFDAIDNGDGNVPER
jgi:hypothetical protein